MALGGRLLDTGGAMCGDAGMMQEVDWRLCGDRLVDIVTGPG
jgi:hypothetical protein